MRFPSVSCVSLANKPSGFFSAVTVMCVEHFSLQQQKKNNPNSRNINKIHLILFGLFASLRKTKKKLSFALLKTKVMFVVAVYIKTATNCIIISSLHSGFKPDTSLVIFCLFYLIQKFRINDESICEFFLPFLSCKIKNSKDDAKKWKNKSVMWFTWKWRMKKIY